MKIRKLIIVVDPLPGKNAGGVQLKARVLAEAAERANLSTVVCDSTAVQVECTGSKETAIFIQRNGRLSPQFAQMAQNWLGQGAWMIEENIFALASAHRPRHPRYRMALMSRDGAHRYALRSAAAMLPPVREYALLPNPRLMAGLEAAIHPSKATERVLLRIGRPDPIKWTQFEFEFANKLASDGGLPVRLVLVGSPYTPDSATLHPNLHIEYQPYGAELQTLYSSADAYIHHSRIGETFGNTLVEARAFGLPVIHAVDLGWDQAPLEVLPPAAVVSGSPRSLTKNAGRVFSEAIARDNQPEALGLDADDFVAQLQGATDGTSMRKVPSALSFVGHVRAQRDQLGPYGAGASTSRAILYESARALKNRQKLDAEFTP